MPDRSLGRKQFCFCTHTGKHGLAHSGRVATETTWPDPIDLPRWQEVSPPASLLPATQPRPTDVPEWVTQTSSPCALNFTPFLFIFNFLIFRIVRVLVWIKCRGRQLAPTRTAQQVQPWRSGGGSVWDVVVLAAAAAAAAAATQPASQPTLGDPNRGFRAQTPGKGGRRRLPPRTWNPSRTWRPPRSASPAGWPPRGWDAPPWRRRPPPVWRHRRTSWTSSPPDAALPVTCPVPGSSSDALWPGPARTGPWWTSGDWCLSRTQRHQVKKQEEECVFRH